MTQSHIDEIVSSFPVIFHGNPPTLRKSIECGDGWFNLVMALCHQLEQYCKNEGISDMSIIHIKQKMGVLSVLTDTQTKSRTGVGLTEILAEFRAQSEKTCEICGKSAENGIIDNGGKHIAMCQSCREKS